MVVDTSEKGRPNDAVKQITCDVLAIREENDPFVSEESMKRIFRACQKLEDCDNIRSRSFGDFRETKRIE